MIINKKKKRVVCPEGKFVFGLQKKDTEKETVLRLQKKQRLR